MVHEHRHATSTQMAMAETAARPICLINPDHPAPPFRRYTKHRNPRDDRNESSTDDPI